MPSNDWGWAVQWIDKTKCDIEIVKSKEIMRPQSAAQSLSRQTDETLRTLLMTARSRDQGVTGRDIFNLIDTL